LNRNRDQLGHPHRLDYARDVSSKLTSRETDDGRRQFIVEHAHLPVKPEMMVWFLKNAASRIDFSWRGHKDVLEVFILPSLEAL
jgi:hypothetical protein